MNTMEESLQLSSVYSLAVQSQGLWLLSGTESGGINLQTVRHDEGKRVLSLRQHNSAVSVLTLAHDEKSVLSGSWDKNVIDWDLNTGQVRNTFHSSAGQIAAIELRPTSSLPIPETSGEPATPNETFSANNNVMTKTTNSATNGVNHSRFASQDKGSRSPADSLFGENNEDADSLFGDNDDNQAGAPSGGNFGDDEDDEFSRAIANGIRQQEVEDESQAHDTGEGTANEKTNGQEAAPVEDDEGSAANRSNADANADLPNGTVTNGIPSADEGENNVTTQNTNDYPISPESISSSDNTFLAASIDGPLRVWDRRQPNPIAHITPRNVPPWCMNACWSPDGNYIYAGRRNGTVEEYSLHKGLRVPERVFKFPYGSGPVSAVRAMPNGRHLVWYVPITK